MADQLTFYNVGGFGGAARRFNLDFYCKVFGIDSPKAEGVTGMDMNDLMAEGRYREGMKLFLEAEGQEARLARKVVAGYISYAFHRVGEVTGSIDGIDRIMATGFNWAPPGVLVDTLGAAATVDMIEKAELPVPEILAEAARTGEPRRFFNNRHINVGRFFVAG